MCGISGKWRKNLVPYHFRLPCVVCSTCCMYRRLYIVTCLMGHINIMLPVFALLEIHFFAPRLWLSHFLFGIAIFVCGSWVMTRHQYGISAVVPWASLGWLSNRTGTSLDDGANQTTGLTKCRAANLAPEAASVLSARFPVVNWCSRSVAKSAYSAGRPVLATQNVGCFLMLLRFAN